MTPDPIIGMPCPTCHSILYYHSDGITCRNCSFKYHKHEKFYCSNCDIELEDSRKSDCLCIFCLYKMMGQLR